MVVKVIEVIEVTTYEPDNMPVRRYFLRDGTPFVVPTATKVQ